MATEIRIPKQTRITTTAAVLLLTIAVLVDGLQFFTKFLHLVPFVGNALAIVIGIFSSFIAGFGYWFWYRLNDIGMFDRAYAKGLVYAGMFVIEMIPLLNALPGWTLSTAVTIALVRREDQTYNEEKQRSAARAAKRQQEQTRS